MMRPRIDTEHDSGDRPKDQNLCALEGRLPKLPGLAHLIEGRNGRRRCGQRDGLVVDEGHIPLPHDKNDYEYPANEHKTGPVSSSQPGGESAHPGDTFHCRTRRSSRPVDHDSNRLMPVKVRTTTSMASISN